MISRLRSILLIALMVLCSIVEVTAGEKPLFSPYVDAKGTIVLPNDFRSTWVHLGTWVLTSTLAGGPGLGPASPKSGIHNVYAPEESIAGYKRSGHWPDGAAIVMEVHTLKWDDLPAGHVIEEGEPLQWFVMVNDSQGRFPGNPNWGNGWGWAVFSRSDSKKNISTDYKKDCAGCHDVAKGTDWVFVTGYPALR